MQLQFWELYDSGRDITDLILLLLLLYTFLFISFLAFSVPLFYYYCYFHYYYYFFYFYYRRTRKSKMQKSVIGCLESAKPKMQNIIRTTHGSKKVKELNNTINLGQTIESLLADIAAFPLQRQTAS